MKVECWLCGETKDNRAYGLCFRCYVWLWRSVYPRYKEYQREYQREYYKQNKNHINEIILKNKQERQIKQLKEIAKEFNYSPRVVNAFIKTIKKVRT